MISVTKPYLPPAKKYKKYIDRIYGSGWITNNGPLYTELSSRLSDYLGVKNFVLVANGTLALNISYKLLNLEKTVITTPFTFVATTSSIVWNGSNVLFSDIDYATFNLDPFHIEDNLSDSCQAIIPVHVFGNACEIDEISKVAIRNNLKVIYDASHAFGVNYKDKSILSYGDISTISFHATKIFHTIEGGGIVIQDDDLFEQAKRIINFGYNSDDDIIDVGINAKMSEFHAAMGLAVLDDIEYIISRRKDISEYYHSSIGTNLNYQAINPDCSYNYAYFPVLFEDEDERIVVEDALNRNNIHPRIYFSPPLTSLPYVDAGYPMPNSTAVSSRVLCLPLYDGLNDEDIQRIVNIINHHEDST